jgi:replicative DNA helicase
LIVLLLSKDSYAQYGSYIDRGHLKDQYKELFYLYSALDKVHAIHPNDVGLQDLQAFFFQTYPDADKDIYLTLFKTLEEVVINPDIGLAMLRDIKARKQALKLSEAAFKFSSGTGDIDNVVEAYDDFDIADEAVEEFQFVTDDLESILDQTVRQQGLRWRLDFLNKSLGSLRKGDFGFLFARPETGKTTFLASEISAMLAGLKDSDGPIIWFNNEEQGSKVMLRLYQAYFGVRLDQLLANPRKYQEEFKNQTQGRFKLVDDANFHKSQVEKLLKQLSPSLMVFDQLTKVKGFAADREDLKLGAICVWARELAKEYAPAIGVFQADGSAEGQKWLTMDHVANVKTAAQAEGDWILGIGKTHAQEAEYLRYLNISKNKLAGDEDSINSLRHGRTEVLIQPEMARYRDIVTYG